MADTKSPAQNRAGSEIVAPSHSSTEAKLEKNNNEEEERESSAWRSELAKRLNLYRERRKPRPPRYPSLRLAFDQPAFHGRGAEGAAFPNVPGIISANALALEVFHSPNSVGLEPEVPHPQAPFPGDDGRSSVPKGQSGSPHVAKIIAFPRSNSNAAPIPIDELAEPVPERPRILDVPDAVLAPPALGGISIEAIQPPATEKRPGIDIPLQSAPTSRRVIAGTVDAVIISAACALGGTIFWKVTGAHPPRLHFLILAAAAPVLFWALYQFLLVIYSGSTPGLRLARLEITCFNGTLASRKLRRWRVLASYLSVASLGMGYAWVFLDEDGLCWHDRITHTYLAPTQGQSEVQVMAESGRVA
ncbi:MAG TPA: RDD family protein [Candidatus Sulfotelmatobacter sp.]